MDRINLHARQHSTQAETFRVEHIFNASPKEIWPQLVNHSSMVDWMPGIKSVQVTPNTEGKEALGCKRVCQFGSETLHEEIILWEENEAYGYTIADNNLITDHVAYVTIEGLGNGKSRVSWIQHLKPKGNFIKQFMMKNVMLPRALKKGLRNLEDRIAS